MQQISNEAFFKCAKCEKRVNLSAPGTRNRNHCPYCLYSMHVDLDTGDRMSLCGGLMVPLGKFYKQDGEEVLVHKCLKCNFLRKNRIAGDDSFELVEQLPVIDPLVI